MNTQPNELNNLIWYAIPGGLLVGVLAIIYPKILRDYQTIAIAAAFVVGFGVHQITRFVFEHLPWGYQGHRRPVILKLKELLNIQDSFEAASVWHMAFHNDEFPEVLRTHDRRMWHFILSVWTFSVAALLGAMLVVVSTMELSVTHHRKPGALLVIVCDVCRGCYLDLGCLEFGLPLFETLVASGLMFTALLTALLGWRIYRVIGEEEVALVQRWRSYFERINEEGPNRVQPRP